MMAAYDEERQGYVALVTSLAEERLNDSCMDAWQPMRWRIDWFGSQPILVLLDPMRLTAPDDSAIGWGLFDVEDRPIWYQPLASLMAAGDTLSMDPGGIVAVED
jgi:hypothetical protein